MLHFHSMRFVVFGFIVSACLIYVIFVSTSTRADYLNSPQSDPKFMRTSFVAKDESYTKIEYTSNRVVEKNEETFLILSSILNLDCYREGRKFFDLFNTLKPIYSNRQSSISLGFLVGTEKEFKVIDKYITDIFGNTEETATPFHLDRVIVVMAPFIEKVYDTAKLADKHDEKLQGARRKKIARLRNFLLSTALKDEAYTIFVDADIKAIPESVIDEFIKSGKDILVPRIAQGVNKDYDLNSWAGTRRKPTEDQLKHLNENNLELYDFIPLDEPDKITHLGSYVKRKKKENSQKSKLPKNFLVKLDSVGGAFLFAKSEIYKQGVVFPPFYLVGTDWDRVEGYDGVETEGLCYIARSIGYECWGMPNQLVQHAL